MFVILMLIKRPFLPKPNAQTEIKIKESLKMTEILYNLLTWLFANIKSCIS